MGGVGMRWPWARKKKAYIVYLGKKGSKRLLGRLEVEDENELVARLDEYISKRCEELKINPNEYATVRLVNAETGQEVRIENPFYEPTEEDVSGRGSPVEPKQIGELLHTALGLQGELYKAVFDGVAEGLKNIVSSSLNLATDLVNTVKAKAIQNIGGSQLSPDQLLQAIVLGGLMRNVERVQVEGGTG